MKKISVLSVLAVLVMPAFAVEDVKNLYGMEPGNADFVMQYNKQFKNTENNNVKENVQEKAKQDLKETKKQIQQVQEPQEIEEVKTVKKIKNVQEVQKVQEIKEPQKNTEPKYEAPANPKARFPYGLQFGVGVSPTSGLNGFIGYNNKKFNSFWAKRFGIRFDFANMSPIKNTLNKRINRYADDHNGIKIKDSLKVDNLKLDAKHYGAMIDFYPFGDTWFLGGWRVSGGYVAGKLKADADVHGTLNGDKVEFELDGKKYTYDGTEMYAKAMADWKFSGPYLGTGFDLGLFWGFKIYMDAGVVFTGNTAKFDLNVPLDGLKDENGVAVTEGSAEYNQFVLDKDKALDDARKEIKDYPYYPLVKLGFMYRF